MSKKTAASGKWTIRSASDTKRGRVTSTTVRELSQTKSLRGVAKIAKKYAK
ncbi:MAG TPA: hypothetical protein VKB13_01040 [Gaiellaceae bacterium]|nr:hypothetical protein [Gaiellaceae bacterium]